MGASALTPNGIHGDSYLIFKKKQIALSQGMEELATKSHSNDAKKSGRHHS